LNAVLRGALGLLTGTVFCILVGEWCVAGGAKYHPGKECCVVAGFALSYEYPVIVDSVMTSNPERWKQRLQNLCKAQQRLEKACAQENYNDLELAGLVQTFEFSFELTWKTLKDLLEFEGFDAASPRSVIRTALEAKHLTSEQCEVLLTALIKRNLLTHTYDESNVLEVQKLIKQDFSPVIASVTAYLTSKSDD
jgi:nucleotidyltransferase substrate binding protein (TIGR01987 family)